MFVQRSIFPKVAVHLSKPEITLIVGARQVGKTVLLQMLQEWLISQKRINAEHILYFNLDIIKDWEFFQNQTEFIEFLKERSRKAKIYVFVDEAQRVPDCARFFKGVYDSRLNVKLVLTGSSSLELVTRFKESLAGRKKVFHLSSFSFQEFLQVKNRHLAKLFFEEKKYAKKTKISVLSQRQLLSLFQVYILWGGYPKAVLAESREEKIDILGEIYTSYIEKDIVGLLEIKNRLAFSNLIKLLAGQIGQLTNINELASSLRLDRETIERYLKALQETFIIYPVSPYFKNPRKEIVKQNKIYFCDQGLRNYALNKFSLEEKEDAGLVLENAVFKEILNLISSFDKVRFWRTKTGVEIDFIIISDAEIKPIEVKFQIKKSLIPSAFRYFIERYHPKNAWVVNLSLQEKIKFLNTKIHFIFPFNLNQIFD